MSNKLIYYVYAYLREDGTPYYIGKGKGSRAYVKSNGHKVKPPEDKTRIIFLKTQLTNFGALAFERWYIRWFGRKDIGTGILRNGTDGGDGGTGMKRSPMSEETKAKISASLMGKTRGPKSEETKAKISIAKKGKTQGPKSEETKAKLRKPRSEETKAKMSASHIGKPRGPMSEETKAKISAARKAKKIGTQEIK